MPAPRRLTLSVVTAAAVAALAVTAGIVLLPTGPGSADAAAVSSAPTATASASVDASAGSETRTAGSTGTASPITLTFAGDSVTHRPHSWMRQLDDPTIRNVGGDAIDGAPTQEILDHARPVDADVLVVMAGVNDVRDGDAPAGIESRIVQIAQRVGARHVVLSAIPPSNRTDYGPHHIDRRVAGAELDRDLEQLAAEQGWEFVDPFSGSRAIDNAWAAGTTVDGVHPTDAVSSVVRDRIQAAVHVAVAGSRG